MRAQIATAQHREHRLNKYASIASCRQLFLALAAWIALISLLTAATSGVSAQEHLRTNVIERVDPSPSTNERLSTKWATVEALKHAAEAGNTRAQVELGAAYLNGVPNLPEDKGQGLKWLREAAEQGDNIGQWLLGQCLERGEGAATNLTEAVEWLSKSARQNNPNAQMELGLCYLNGQGVVTNKAEGLRWLQAAAETGSPLPQFLLGLAYQTQATLDSKDNESAKKAVEWFTKAADQGMENAQFLLGQCYQFGRGVQQDSVEAYKWMLLANRSNPKPVIPAELMEKLSARQLREGLERSKAFVPYTNAVTFGMPPMPDWIEQRTAPSADR